MSSGLAAERTPSRHAGVGRPAQAILWPAFVMAGALEALVFASVDPHALPLLETSTALPPIAIHSIAFFVFWGVIATSAAVTLWLSREVLAAGRVDR